MRFYSRVQRLERDCFPQTQDSIRVIIRCVVGKSNLANSFCQRTIFNGTLIEVLNLESGMGDLTESDLDHFIESIPIQGATR